MSILRFRRSHTTNRWRGPVTPTTGKAFCIGTRVPTCGKLDPLLEALICYSEQLDLLSHIALAIPITWGIGSTRELWAGKMIHFLILNVFKFSLEWTQTMKSILHLCFYFFFNFFDFGISTHFGTILAKAFISGCKDFLAEKIQTASISLRSKDRSPDSTHRYPFNLEGLIKFFKHWKNGI